MPVIAPAASAAARPAGAAGRRAHGYLWGAAVLATVGLVLAAVEIGIYVGHAPPPANRQRTLVELCEYAVQGPILLLGGLLALLRRGARSALGWLLLVPATVFMLAACLSTWLRFATAVTPGVRAAVYAEFGLWQVPRIGWLLFPLCFPTPWVPKGWPARFGLLLGTAVGGYELAVLLTLPQWHPGATTMPNALLVPALVPLFRKVRPAVEVILCCGVLVMAVSPVLQWRDVDERCRRLITIIVPIFVCRAGEEFIRLAQDWSSLVVAAKVAASLAGGLGVSYWSVRDRLFDIERNSRRIIAVAVPLVLLATVYAGAAVTVSALLPGRNGAVFAVLAVLAALAGFGLRPATRWVQRRVDRLVYGGRPEPYELARRLADRLREGADPVTVPLAVCQIAVSALRLPGAAVTAGVGDGARALAELGTGDPPQRIELRHQGRLVGHLRVAPRAGAAALDGSDLSALEALADVAAPVVSALLLAEEVRSSRARVDRVREHERSALERHVHDGVGPLLATIRLQVGTARALVPDGSPSGELLGRAAAELGEAIAEFARVTERLRPPVLDERGLAGALAALAARLSTPDLPVRCAPAELPPVPPAVELAGYRIAAEAVTNAIRHAAASAVELSLAVAGDTLLLRVSDDGTGLAHTGRRGVGLASMAQRAADVGGVCAVTGGPGGTTVTARLPLAATGPAD